MKRKKLLKKLSDLLTIGTEADKDEVGKLRDVLKALKVKQADLQEELESVQGDHERRKISKQIEVIRRQREKGIEVYKSIKEARQQ
ncbi:hypothetical protein [Pseudohalioglobus lutimaris]|uniref:Uncharacterized protein n=1 Tax=Pseudohalioglobus lutimaris TaxID=1737061 RepID=A0A2N5X8B1_9GAMM|nr:hypothetical protein [Pseudohalioglobus lutimaris]PLW70721.1 hypothetical protein C0039_00895 [Pseudohalioglobus lutimaris]